VSALFLSPHRKRDIAEGRSLLLAKAQVQVTLAVSAEDLRRVEALAWQALGQCRR
jgi:hypothetical protein